MMKTTRLEIRIPADWLEALRAEADRRETSVSELIREAVRRRIAAGRRLSDPKRPGRPKADA